jgi:hypothetical protein
MNRKILVALFAVGLAGCITRIDVRPAAPDVEGTRYALPKPLLMANPQADGTMAFSWIYVPDDDHTYAIATSSVLAKHKTTIDLENGLLKKISWAPDSTAVAAQVASSAAEVAKARLTAIDAERKAEQTKADAKVTAIQTARDDMRTAETNVAKIQAEIEALKETHQDDKIPEAQVRLAIAKAELEAKKKKLDDLTSGRTGSSVGGAGNVAEGGTSPSTPPPLKTMQFKQAPGPVFFEVVEEFTPVHTVRLVPINKQENFNTRPAPPARPQFTLKSAVAEKPENGGPLRVTITSTVPIKSIVSDRALMNNAATQADTTEFFMNAALTSTTTIEAVLRPDTPSGTYELSIPFVTEAGPEDVRIDVTFAVDNPATAAKTKKK